MVKCGCASDRCSCTIIPGDGVDIAGNGTPSNPYVVTAIPTEAAGPGSDVSRFSGEITMYGGPTPPSGWLNCNGAAVSRTVYAALFAAVGVAYGAGDGSTTFNLPNLSGRFPVGVDGTHGRGTQGGSSALTTAHLPQHNHSIDHNHAAAQTTADGLHDHPTYHRAVEGTSSSTFNTADTDGRVQDNNLVGDAGSHSHTVDLPAFSGTSGNAGSASPAAFEPLNTAVNFIIKV